MPLYSELYHNYVGNTPVVPGPIVSSYPSSTYTPPSFVGVSRGFTNPHITATRVPSFSRGYMPRLTPITETPLTARRVTALTRVNSPKYIPSHASPTYQKPRRIINTADIDVSASRYVVRDLTPKRDHYVSISPTISPTSSVTESKLHGLSSSAMSVREQELIERNEQRKARSNINRNRAVVRLNTMRARSKSRGSRGSRGSHGSRGSNERQSPRRSESELTFEEDMLFKEPQPKSTSWRDQFREELSSRSKKAEPVKSPGELLLEKHLIRDEGDIPLIIDEIIYKSPVMKRRASVRRKSTAKMPSFHEICSDINSDRLDDDLNAGELRRRASQIIEDEIAQFQEELQKSNGLLNDNLEERLKEALEQQITDSGVEFPEKKKLKKIKRTKTKPLPKIDADNNVVQDQQETPALIKISADDATIVSSVIPVIKAEVEIIEECTVFKLPKKKKKLTAGDTSADSDDKLPKKTVEKTESDPVKTSTTDVPVPTVEVVIVDKSEPKVPQNVQEAIAGKIDQPMPPGVRKPEPPEKKVASGELAERIKAQELQKKKDMLSKLNEKSRIPGEPESPKRTDAPVEQMTPANMLENKTEKSIKEDASSVKTTSTIEQPKAPEERKMKPYQKTDTKTLLEKKLEMLAMTVEKSPALETPIKVEVKEVKELPKVTTDKTETQSTESKKEDSRKPMKDSKTIADPLKTSTALDGKKVDLPKTTVILEKKIEAPKKTADTRLTVDPPKQASVDVEKKVEQPKTTVIVDKKAELSTEEKKVEQSVTAMIPEKKLELQEDTKKATNDSKSKTGLLERKSDQLKITVVPEKKTEPPKEIKTPKEVLQSKSSELPSKTESTTEELPKPVKVIDKEQSETKLVASVQPAVAASKTPETFKLSEKTQDSETHKAAATILKKPIPEQLPKVPDIPVDGPKPDSPRSKVPASPKLIKAPVEQLKPEEPPKPKPILKPAVRKKTSDFRLPGQPEDDFWGHIGTRETICFARRKQDIERRNQMVMLKFSASMDNEDGEEEETAATASKMISTKLMPLPPASEVMGVAMSQWPKSVEDLSTPEILTQERPNPFVSKNEAEVLPTNVDITKKKQEATKELPKVGQAKKAFEVTSVKEPIKMSEETQKESPTSKEPAKMLDPKNAVVDTDAFKQPLKSVGLIKTHSEQETGKAVPKADEPKTIFEESKESREPQKKPDEQPKAITKVTNGSATKNPDESPKDPPQPVALIKPHPEEEPASQTSSFANLRKQLEESTQKDSAKAVGLKTQQPQEEPTLQTPTFATLRKQLEETTLKNPPKVLGLKKQPAQEESGSQQSGFLALRKQLEESTKEPPKLVGLKKVLKKTDELPPIGKSPIGEPPKSPKEAITFLKPTAEQTKTLINPKLSPKEMIMAVAPNMAAAAERKLAQAPKIPSVEPQEKTVKKPEAPKEKPSELQAAIEPKQAIVDVNNNNKVAATVPAVAVVEEKKTKIVKKVIKVVKPKGSATDAATAKATAERLEAERRKAQENVEKMKAKLNQITLNMGDKYDVEIKECAKCQQATLSDTLPVNKRQPPKKKALGVDKPQQPPNGDGAKLTKNKFGAVANLSNLSASSAGARLVSDQVLTGADQPRKSQVQGAKAAVVKAAVQYSSSSSEEDSASGTSFSGIEDDWSSDEDDMANDKPEKKKFDPQKRVKLNVDQMRKCYSKEEKSPIVLVARPRPLWKVKRHGHGHNRKADLTSSSSSGSEDESGSTTDQTSSETASTVSASSDINTDSSVNSSRGANTNIKKKGVKGRKKAGAGAGDIYDTPMVIPLHSEPPSSKCSSKDENNNDSGSQQQPAAAGTEEDDENNKNIGNHEIRSTSTSSHDSGFFGGGTAPISPKKAMDCDVNCHKKCEKLAANLCGVNQKLIVEALSSVRRGAHDARDSPSSTPPSANPAYRIETPAPPDYASGGGYTASGKEDDSETSYTYAQFQKTGKLTAPATVIPRFRKYNVDDFHFLTVLGKGSFGKVFLAELRNTEYYYAVKCLKKDVVLEDDDVDCTLIERKVLALGTKHPFLCHLFCTFQTDSHLFFVMEYLNGGDLMFHIQQSGRFPEPRARFYAAEIVSGLKFLHRKGIVYRDLKLDNVLLDYDGHVRIADFGMCKLEIYLDRLADSFCGTPDYMAPEIIKGQKYNQAVDWWSFGVLVYEMLVGQSPFSGCDEDELFWSICNEIPWFPHYLSKEALKLLKSLLEKDATIRLGCLNTMDEDNDVKYHTFFDSIDWQKLERRQLEPPFKPQVRHPLDTQYFDKQFTRERARLTPIERNILASMNQAQFEGFTYTNPNNTLTKLREKQRKKEKKMYFCPQCGDIKVTYNIF